MFDNLRDLSDSESPFYEEEQNELYKEPEESVASGSSATPARRRSKRLLSMNAQQRFILSLMLFFTVCLIGTLAMFVLGRMSLF